MALQVYNFSITETNVVADLGVTDDAFVAGNVQLVSESDITINGTGSGHSVEVEGNVFGHLGAVALGDSASLDSGQRLTIGTDGSVIGVTYLGALIYGSNSVVKNHGQLGGEGGGVAMYGDDGATTSRLVNTGIILSTHTHSAAVYRNGHEDFRFVNRGEVEAESGVAYDGTDPDAAQTIINAGRIKGDVRFGTGEDVYKGSAGRVIGIINGDEGNDSFTGGLKIDRFQGDEGRDMMRGGGRADQFIYTLLGDSTVAQGGRDLIVDFGKGADRIDLEALDAIQSTVDDDSFSFVGKNAFSAEEGELRYFFLGKKTLIQGDVDGDGTADFAIELKGRLNLTETDFGL
jgi:hypothetical protein